MLYYRRKNAKFADFKASENYTFNGLRTIFWQPYVLMGGGGGGGGGCFTALPGAVFWTIRVTKQNNFFAKTVAKDNNLEALLKTFPNWSGNKYGTITLSALECSNILRSSQTTTKIRKKEALLIPRYKNMDLTGFYPEQFKMTAVLDNTKLYTRYGLRNV